ncbi:glycosyltransferase family 39 protein [Occallatibacter savannae]|uniref:glycosyltransferase family 39 protein n=1 Tax=Occallatibacter savannae TaxID=1002691 RepID=UPI000D68E3BE|nr:glycosyltransferase family 39 protein [Occallatibacter savannae]
MSSSVGLSSAAESRQGESESVAVGPVQVAYVLAVIVLAGAGIWLRAAHVDAQSMWADEGYTTWLTKYRFAAILSVLPNDNHPPLYYFLLHVWRSVFGSSVFAMRGLSVIASVLCLPVIYVLGRKIFQSWLCALIALAFASISFLPIWYAQEVRGYALLEFESSVCVLSMIFALEKMAPIRLLLVSLFGAAVLYTHTMTLFYIPGFVIFWMIYPSALSKRQRLNYGAAASGIMLLIYAPWISILRQQIRGVHSDFWAVRPGLTTLLDVVCSYCGVATHDLQVAFRTHLPGTKLFGFMTWVPIVMLALGFGLYQGLSHQKNDVRRKALAMAAISVLPIVLAFVDSRVLTPIFIDRVFMGAGVFLPLVFCFPVAFSAARNLSLRLTPVVVVLMIAGLSCAVRHEKRDDWRGVTEYALNLPVPHREVFAFQPFCQMLMDYYANRLPNPVESVELSGLMTKAGLEDEADPKPHIPVLANADPLGTLGEEIDSHRYAEIDVALQMYRLTPGLLAMPKFMETHCSSMSVIDFGGIRVTRCMLSQH